MPPKIIILLSKFMLLLGTISSQAAISITYDNDSGFFSISGSDTGPGQIDSFDPNERFYVWSFDSFSSTYSPIFDAIAAEGLSGTVGGVNTTTISTGSSITGFNTYGFYTEPSGSAGTLSIDPLSGTIATGLWTGTGIEIGDAVDSVTGEALTLTIVPEPSLWSSLLGSLAIVIFVIRKRLARGRK